MDTTPQPPLFNPSAEHRRSVLIKIISICGLIGLLHVPVGMTHGVLRERRGYQQQAVTYIAGIWGGHQLVIGPVLAVPYAYRTRVIRNKVVNGKAVQVEETELAPATAYFLPETLEARVAADPEVRHRGIYDAVVYSAGLQLTGTFRPDFGAADIAADRIDWDKAEVRFNVSDLHGLRSVGPLKLAGGQESEFAAGTGSLLALGARIAGAKAGEPLEFSLAATVQGSGQLLVAPVGKTTTVTMHSPWPDPSFTGGSLPVSHTVGPDGFKAEWQSAQFSRGFAQSWTDRASGNKEVLAQIAASGLGVSFAQPVDGYGMSERAQKYAVLFFVLVFAVYFLFEVTAGLRIHPLQYAMVGAALCLFFLGFLALSEFLRTGPAYATAAGACTLLIAIYSWSFLRSGGRTLVICGGLAATYGYLYFVLRSQDYALIAGTAALFATLALVMFCTRRINWYAVQLPGASSSTS